MGLLAPGMTGEQVASSSFLSSETIKTHMRNAMTKLEANTRVHAVALALREGFISTPAGAREPRRSRCWTPKRRRRLRHDLRTPLTIVAGFAEVLAGERDISEADRREFAQADPGRRERDPQADRPGAGVTGAVARRAR